METSLAEDVQEQKMTLLPESFFFMSPYRSFPPRAVLAVFPTRPPMARRRVPAEYGGRVSDAKAADP
jgi:hypothetical protein